MTRSPSRSACPDESVVTPAPKFAMVLDGAGARCSSGGSFRAPLLLDVLLALPSIACLTRRRSPSRPRRRGPRRAPGSGTGYSRISKPLPTPIHAASLPVSRHVMALSGPGSEGRDRLISIQRFELGDRGATAPPARRRRGARRPGAFPYRLTASPIDREEDTGEAGRRHRSGLERRRHTDHHGGGVGVEVFEAAGTWWAGNSSARGRALERRRLRVERAARVPHLRAPGRGVRPTALGCTRPDAHRPLIMVWVDGEWPKVPLLLQIQEASRGWLWWDRIRA